MSMLMMLLSSASSVLCTLAVPILLVSIVVWVARKYLGGTAQSFVISSMEVEEEQIQIAGRSQGILAFVLSRMGIEPSMHFKANREQLLFEYGSIRGFVRTVVPIRAVSSIDSGVRRPLVVSAAVGVLAGGATVMLGALVAAVVDEMLMLFVLPVAIVFALVATVAYYALRKTMYIVVRSGSKEIGFTLKASVIEGIALNTQAVQEIQSVVCDLATQSSECAAPNAKMP